MAPPLFPHILRRRTDEHLSRKIFHIMAGTIFVYFYTSVFTRTQSIVLICVGGALDLAFELLRLRFPALNRFMLQSCGSLMRQNEVRRMSGQIYFIFGVAFSIIFLPKVVAVQAILTLTWLDPIAGIFGVRFGRQTWNAVFERVFVEGRPLPISLGAKTIEGSIAGFIAAFLAGIYAWTSTWAAQPLPSGILWWPSPLQIGLLSATGALVSMVAEAWPSQWDDNVNIPFWTGIAVAAMACVLGVPLKFA